MKKYILFILLLLVPFMVHAADVEIKSIEFVDKSENAEILEDASVDVNKIKLNISFKSLNDQIRYKITIQNNTDKDYSLDSNKELSNYVTASFVPLESNEEVLKANSTQTIYFIIKYTKEVPLEEFESDTSINTQETKVLELSAKDNTITIEEKENPKTNATIPIVVSVLLITSGIVVVILLKKKRTFSALIVLFLSIPLSIHALEKVTIEVESKIEIKHAYFTLGGQPYLFDLGMTWRDYLASDYNIYGWYETSEIDYISQYVNGELQGHWEYIENDGVGIWTGIVESNCNPYLSLKANMLIRNSEGLELIDNEIIDEYDYYLLYPEC